MRPRHGSRQWQRCGVVPESEHKAEQRRLLGVLDDYELDARYVNPSAASLTHHHIPHRTTQIGKVLDLSTRIGDQVTSWDTELAGWVMLTDARAEQMRPGAASLYLVRLKPTGVEPNASAAQEATYEMWHKRPADETLELEVPDFCGVFLGHAVTIGYASDKWESRGSFIDYEHDFSESGLEPEVWANAPNLADACGVVIRGGDMRVTVRGID